ncbi:hypothetical protein BZB76_2531 [Actinomadura pelletieri DSM 43383]|uniref:Uncharacterized protein n=1 Tax=Actinomadura pelletieri DSM 43383 TaxID=1120940 RepID=A0A495QUF5_9ACTN|nr:hypothetical protein [Actinomadura pelletieri]RKS77156.1 hypothetical protein BZB76_2531 [Actinomadura pelletieri DSM 43383]
MLELVTELQRTSIARWTVEAFGEESLHGSAPEGRRRNPRHTFCRAAYAHLAGLEADVDFAAVQVTRADLKRLTGHGGEGALYRTFRESEQSLANLLGREMDGEFGGGAPELVITEMKVWSHWPYRRGWLEALETSAPLSRRFAAETLVRVLVEWAMHNPRAAQVLECLPPPSVVEDLCVISGRQVSPRQAVEVLRHAVKSAIELEGAPALEVLNVVHEDLMRAFATGHLSYVDELAGITRNLMEEIEYLWPRLGAAERERLAKGLRPMVAELHRRLEKEHR